MDKLLIFALILFSGCFYTSNITKIYHQGDSPFKVINEENVITLPDSIPSEIKRGKVAFHFFINDAGKIEGINIAYLKLISQDGNQILRFTQPKIIPVKKSDYPKGVIFHSRYLFHFAEKSKVVKVGEVKEGEKYLYRLIRDIVR